MTILRSTHLSHTVPYCFACYVGGALVLPSLLFLMGIGARIDTGGWGPFTATLDAATVPGMVWLGVIAFPYVAALALPPALVALVAARRMGLRSALSFMLLGVGVAMAAYTLFQVVGGLLGLYFTWSLAPAIMLTTVAPMAIPGAAAGLVYWLMARRAGLLPGDPGGTGPERRDTSQAAAA